MKTKLMILAFSLTAVLCMGAISFAAPIETWGTEIEIIGYDVISTLALEERTGPGGVGTSAYYTGSVSGGTTIKSYTGGEGTLNDGVTDGGIDDGQQMLSTNIGTSIILYFSTEHQYTINGLLISGGDPNSGLFLPNNILPGGLSGMSMVVGEVSTEVLPTVQENFVPGPHPELYDPEIDSIYVDDYLDLTGSEFDLLREQAVQSIVLTNFDADTEIFRNGGELFTLSEIQIFGDIYVEDPGTAPVPEPSTFLLLGIGLITVLLVGRKRCRARA